MCLVIILENSFILVAAIIGSIITTPTITCPFKYVYCSCCTIINNNIIIITTIIIIIIIVKNIHNIDNIKYDYRDILSQCYSFPATLLRRFYYKWQWFDVRIPTILAIPALLGILAFIVIIVVIIAAVVVVI